MKFIKSFKIFETIHDPSIEYNELMGRILHLYGSIPVPKEKSAVVIKKIISTSGKSFKLGDDIDIAHNEVHDKIRFSDYLDSLLEDKDVRGHNFEGLIAGLFNGTLSRRGVKYDVTIDNKRYSVKFVDHKGKAPEIGRFKSIITSNKILDDEVKGIGLTRIFKSDNMQLKSKIWEDITPDIDGWILAYPDVIDDPYIPTRYIKLNIIDKPKMFEILKNGYVVAPKGGYSDLYSLALSSRYIRNFEYTTSTIKIPQVTIEELKSEYQEVQSEDKWAYNVFGSCI